MYIFDVEGDSLTPTKIYCVNWYSIKDDTYGGTTNQEEIKQFFLKDSTFIGHNIIHFDIPAVEKIYNIKVISRLIDTLGLSWYLYPRRARHGLAEWGEEFGIPKPKIDDWENLPLEEYVHRCEEDVRINTKLWKKQYSHLQRLYDTDKEIDRLVNYISMKLDTIRRQEDNGWPLDINLAKKSIRELSKEFEIKNSGLVKAMPKVEKFVKK